MKQALDSKCGKRSVTLSAILVLWVFLGFSVACKSRMSGEDGAEAQSGGAQKAAVPAKSSKKAATSVAARPLLLENSVSSRKTLADSLENQFAEVVQGAPADVSGKLLKETILATVTALRKGANALCQESEKITLYQGTGKLKYKTAQGTFVQMADAVGSNPNSFEILKAAKQFASPAAFVTKSDGTKVPSEDQLNPFSYFDLAKRHSGYASGSIFLSTSLNLTVAQNFGDYVFELRVCPQRAIPSNYSATSGSGSFMSESEFLLLAFILPEEVVSTTPMTRKSATHPLLGCYPPQLSFTNFVKGKELAPVYGEFFNNYYAGLLEGAENVSSGKSGGFESFYTSLISKNCNCAWYLSQLNAGKAVKLQNDVCEESK